MKEEWLDEITTDTEKVFSMMSAINHSSIHKCVAQVQNA